LEGHVSRRSGGFHEWETARRNVKTDGRYFLITLDSIGIDGGLKVEHKQTDVWDNSLKKNDIVAVLSDIAHGNLLGLCDVIPEDDKYVLNQRMGRLRLKVAADHKFATRRKRGR
jgi:type I restriction enzyme S subunit